MALDIDDRAPLEETFSVGGAQYTVREATEAAAVAYRNAVLRASKFGAGGNVESVQGVDAEPALVSQCVFAADGKQVPLANVMGWRSAVVKKLFEWIQEHSDLREKKKGAANGQPGAGAST